jgi:hypothetical protein
VTSRVTPTTIGDWKKELVSIYRGLLKNFKGSINFKDYKKCIPASLVLTKAYSMIQHPGKSNLVR